LDQLDEPVAIAQWSAQVRRKGGTIGLVPTMGALHDGHKSLIDRSLSETGWTVCSIFVNPLQFNDPDDLKRYPRQLEKDLELLRKSGCHLAFTPSAEDMYQGVRPLTYDLGGLDGNLEGPLRPGHFQGVVNVVERLFHYVRPDRAFFGEKDWQQLAVIRHTAHELRWPVAIEGCPTLREPDGLAMSSRNQRLGTADRQRATVLYRALKAVAAMAFSSTPIVARKAGLEVLRSEPEVALEYLEITDAITLAPLNEWGERAEAMALIAARVGPVRLIDNISLHR
jgi:pantoate--beta-alanine ligase